MKAKEESEKAGLKQYSKTKTMASCPKMANRQETMETVTDYLWAPKSLQMVTAAMKLRHLLLGRKAMTNLDSILKSKRHSFANKGPSS